VIDRDPGVESGTSDTDPAAEPVPDSPLHALRRSLALGNINDLTQRDVDALIARLREQTEG
jgi:hypothetical protein